MNDLKKSLNAWFKEEKFKQAYQDIGCSKEHLALILIKMYSDNALISLWNDSHFQKICHNSTLSEDELTKILIGLQIYFKSPLFIYTTEYDSDFLKNLSKDETLKKISRNKGYSLEQLASIIACGKLTHKLLLKGQNQILTADKLNELRAAKKPIQRVINLLQISRILPSPIDQSNWINHLSESLKFFDDLPKSNFKIDKSPALRGDPIWTAILNRMMEYSLELGISSKKLLVSLVEFVDPNLPADLNNMRRSLNVPKLQQEQDADLEKFISKL
jgi:hypothetical protein